MYNENHACNIPNGFSGKCLLSSVVFDSQHGQVNIYLYNSESARMMQIDISKELRRQCKFIFIDNFTQILLSLPALASLPIQGVPR